MQKQLLKRNFVAKKSQRGSLQLKGSHIFLFFCGEVKNGPRRKIFKDYCLFPDKFPPLINTAAEKKKKKYLRHFSRFLAEKVCRPPWNKRAPLSFQVRYGVKEGFIFIFFSRRVGETVVRRTFSLSVRSHMSGGGSFTNVRGNPSGEFSRSLWPENGIKVANLRKQSTFPN